MNEKDRDRPPLAPPQGFRPVGRGDYPAAKFLTLEQELTHLINYHSNLVRLMSQSVKPDRAWEILTTLNRATDRINELLGLKDEDE
jgi:hypothetical protein